MSQTKALFTFNDAGDLIPATADEIIAAAREHLSRRVRRGVSLASPQAVRDFLAVKLGAREFESFCVFFLDNRHRVIEFVELFRGTIDAAAVYPREVVKEALKRNAAAVLCVHPHPSGVAEVSAADELITKKLVSALDTVGIRMIDHCVVAGGDVVSMVERGLM